MVCRAFLDTNVIYGELSTIMLLDLAEQWLYVPYWSDYVEEELRQHLTDQLKPGSLTRRLANMNNAFPDARLVDWRRYERLSLNFVTDPNDAAIIAGAITCNADYLVTNNVSDFMQDEIFSLLGVKVITLGDFLSKTMEQVPDESWSVLLNMVLRNKKAPRTMRELYAKLASMSETSSFAAMLMRYATERHQSQGGPAGDVWGADGNGY